MTRALLLSLLLAAGCTEQVLACPNPGEVFDGTSCHPQMDGAVADAGPDADPDGGLDAGPCGGMCADDEQCRDDGTCVHCLGDAECDALRPTCEDGECVARCVEATCMDNHAGVAPHCGSGGACVQCLPGTEAADCGGNSCDPRTNTCTMTPIRSLTRCMPCTSSSECRQYDDAGTLRNMACARTTWDGGTADFACVVESPGATVPCPDGTPRLANDLDTIEGTPSDFCLPISLTTCAALVDNADCTLDSQCGLPDEDDGRCLFDVCETPCTLDRDCPDPQTCADVSGRGQICSG